MASPPRSPRRPVPPALSVFVFALLGLAGCLAPPPPIAVVTPNGEVRGETLEEANRIARLLNEFTPRVRQILPGTQDRPIDVWVQDELKVYRHQVRPESVRGFTLLTKEFEAKRIHLQADGQSRWYLAHELVHALIGPSWNTLPGILEEGLGDVVAEMLNPSYSEHIRAHRLLNASAFSDGFYVDVVYTEPDDSALVDPSLAEEFRRVRRTRVQPDGEGPVPELRELFSASRSRLHKEWPEVPESFYGLAWLVTARIVERQGLEGLHDLCLLAEEEGYELIPVEWLFAAADIEEELDADFLASCFGEGELRAAAYLRADLFAGLTVDLLRPLSGSVPAGSSLIDMTQPAFRLQNGREIHVRDLGFVVRGMKRSWGGSGL